MFATTWNFAQVVALSSAIPNRIPMRCTMRGAIDNWKRTKWILQFLCFFYSAWPLSSCSVLFSGLETGSRTG